MFNDKKRENADVNLATMIITLAHILKVIPEELNNAFDSGKLYHPSPANRRGYLGRCARHRVKSAFILTTVEFSRRGESAGMPLKCTFHTLDQQRKGTP